MTAHRHDPTRRRFLAGSASAMALGALVPTTSASAAQMDRDLLDLLYAQEQQLIDLYAAILDAFDETAFREAGFADDVRPAIESIRAAEAIHQDIVTRPDRPPLTGPEPMLPEDVAAALRQAAAMENLAVAAYVFAIPELGRQRLIPDLLGILSVEARHAAWLATVLGEDPFPAAIDAPLSLQDEDPGEAAGTPIPSENAEADADLGPIVAAIAAELGVAPVDVTVVSTSQEVWPDASLGCPQPDMLYAQVVTSGFRVVVEAGGEQVEFHSDQSGNVVRCP
jgi:hypothetical protein